jgi:hypothetical protein
MSDSEPFEEFLRRTREARPEDYADAVRAGAEFAGRAPQAVAAEFERMKQYILDTYEGVHPVGSFLGPSGQVIDCVPFDQQPSVRAARAAGLEVTRRPSPPVLPQWQQSQAPPRHDHPGAAAAAEVGGPSHAFRCPEGNVPLMRITLEHLLRLGSLDNFFHKSPGKVAPGESEPPHGDPGGSP